MAEQATHPISFTVSVINSTTYTSAHPVIFPNVITNQGDAFNVTSGQFVTPVNGTYMFHVTVTTTNPVADSSVDNVYLIIDGHPMSVAVSGRPSGFYDTGNVDTVRSLREGQKVYLHNAAGGWHNLPYSLFFSGYLLHVDTAA